MEIEGISLELSVFKRSKGHSQVEILVFLWYQYVLPLVASTAVRQSAGFSTFFPAMAAININDFYKKTFCIIMPYGFGSYINIDKLFVIINQKNHNNYHHG